MCPHSLNRRIASCHFRNNRIVIVRVEPSTIANLSARLGVERCVVEDDLTVIAGIELLHALAVFDDGSDFAVVGSGLTVAFEGGFRKLLVRGVGRLLGGAFPGGAGAVALLSHGDIESSLIQNEPVVAARVLDEITRQAERVIEAKGFIPSVDRSQAWSHASPIRRRYTLSEYPL